MEFMAQQAAEALISSLVLGAGIAAVAWCALRAMPPGKAGSRFLVWFTALAAITLVPVLQIAARLKSSSPSVASGLSQAGSGWIVLSTDWAAYVLWSWAVLSCVGLARVFLGLLHLRRLRSGSRIIDPAELVSEAHETAVRAAQQRSFELRTSDEVRMPMAIGFFKPAILIPTDLIDELSPAQLSHVLLHETTHLLRYDDWTNLIQKIARAILFFHPAVWLLESKLTLEREMACDEAVVAHTSDPRSYAECLALLAERSVLKRSLALVQAAVSRFHHTTLRVKALMSPGHRPTSRAWGAATGVIGVVAVSTALVQAPNLVSFAPTSTPGSQAVAQTVARAPQSTAIPAPEIVSAAFRQKESHVSRPSHRSKEMAQASMPKGRPDPFAQREGQDVPQLVLATERTDDLVPVAVTTTVFIESRGSAAPEQVWGIWQLTVYYSATQKTNTALPRRT